MSSNDPEDDVICVGDVVWVVGESRHEWWLVRSLRDSAYVIAGKDGVERVVSDANLVLVL